MEDIVLIEEINDGNLFLRKVSKDDISFFYQSLKEKEMINYLSLGPLRSLEHSKRMIKNYLRSWDKFLQFNYIIELRDDRTVKKIGSVSLWAINWHHRRSGVGIWILPEYWEHGLGSRSIVLIKRIAFNHLNLNRVEAYIATQNERSINMFKKCNFVEEGLLKKYLKIESKFQDALIVACLKN
ncbi:MAG: GNAT family N-acetyltransferase [Candidatus Lokiarchaeota archaeon]|nr:GNAT family N-acetyltransferase [Candidatus Lokiarchaeota archaeon]